jgi:hypothetical protein
MAIGMLAVLATVGNSCWFFSINGVKAKLDNPMLAAAYFRRSFAVEQMFPAPRKSPFEKSPTARCSWPWES